MKKPALKGYILHYFTYERRVQMSGCQGLRIGREGVAKKGDRRDLLIMVHNLLIVLLVTSGYPSDSLA